MHQQHAAELLHLCCCADFRCVICYFAVAGSTLRLWSQQRQLSSCGHPASKKSTCGHSRSSRSAPRTTYTASRWPLSCSSSKRSCSSCNPCWAPQGRWSCHPLALKQQQHKPHLQLLLALLLRAPRTSCRWWQGQQRVQQNSTRRLHRLALCELLMLLLKPYLMAKHGLGAWMQQLQQRESLEGRARQPSCGEQQLRRLAAAVAAAPFLVPHCWVIRTAEIVQQLRSSQQRVLTPSRRHQQAMEAA